MDINDELKRIKETYEAEGNHALQVDLKAKIEGSKARALARVFSIADLASLNYEEAFQVILITGLSTIERMSGMLEFPSLGEGPVLEQLKKLSNFTFNDSPSLETYIKMHESFMRLRKMLDGSSCSDCPQQDFCEDNKEAGGPDIVDDLASPGFDWDSENNWEDEWDDYEEEIDTYDEDL